MTDTPLSKIKPSLQWVPAVLSPGVKWPGREAVHSPLSSEGFQNEWSCTHAFLYACMTCTVTANLHFGLPSKQISANKLHWLARFHESVQCEQSYVTKPIGGLTGLFVFLTTPKTTNPATRPWVSVRPWPTWSRVLRSAAWARCCSVNLLHDWFERAERRVALQNCVRLLIEIIRFLMSQHVSASLVYECAHPKDESVRFILHSSKLRLL
jgi:hypothetical protein